MGVFLVADDEVGGFHHGRGQMAVRIQFRADHRVRADDLARAAQQVALAIVVAVGHHRAVQAEQRHVHGAGVAQVLQQLVAQRFIGVASGDAGRHGGGGQAFDQRPVLALGALPRPQRTGIHLHAVRMLAGRVIAARAVGAQAGGDGGKGIGFGCQGTGKDLHAATPCRALAGCARPARVGLLAGKSGPVADPGLHFDLHVHFQRQPCLHRGARREVGREMLSVGFVEIGELRQVGQPDGHAHHVGQAGIGQRQRVLDAGDGRVGLFADVAAHDLPSASIGIWPDRNRKPPARVARENGSGRVLG